MESVDWFSLTGQALQSQRNAVNLGLGEPQFIGNRVVGPSFSPQLADQLGIGIGSAVNPRAATDVTLSTGAVKASVDPLAEANPLLFSKGSQDAYDGVLENASAIKVLLRVALEPNAVAG
jgi:hypothetical protein